MRFDSLSTLAEVMPYFGTLDQTFVLMKSMSINSSSIWDKWKTQFSKQIKRKAFELDFNSFQRIITTKDKFLHLFLCLFEVSEVIIKSEDEYKIFIEKISKWQFASLIKIRDLKAALSTKDDFHWTYQRACAKIEYDDNDRLLDQHYNELEQTISKLNLSVGWLRSFLYIDEVKNRNISCVDRVVVIIGENMNVNRFKKKLSEIETKNIKVNWFWFVLDSSKTFETQNFIFTNYQIYENLKCKLIEVFVNSEFNTNIIAYVYLYLYFLNINSKVVHLKPSDKIWNYQEFFRGSLLDEADFHFSSTKNTKLVIRSEEGSFSAPVRCKSIQWNLKANEEQYAFSMIKVRKWSQMVVELDSLQIDDTNIGLVNKYNAIKSNLHINEICIFVDEDCIQKIWRKTVNVNIWTYYKNLEYYKAELTDAWNDIVLKGFDALEKRLKRLKVNLNFTLQPESLWIIFYICFSRLNEFIIEHLKINFKNYFEIEDIDYILETIQKFKRAKNIWFEVNDERILEFILLYIQTFGFWYILTIQSKIKISKVSELILKRKWKQFYYKFTE